MSERGSFVTQYVNCKRCFAAAKTVLNGKDKYLFCQVIGEGTTQNSWAPGEGFPIIAGKIGGMYSGEELVTFKNEYAPALEAVICCPLRVAVLADDGECIFLLQPQASRSATREMGLDKPQLQTP